MNNLAAPFDDQRVRLAVAKSIDRQRIVDTLFFGTARLRVEEFLRATGRQPRAWGPRPTTPTAQESCSRRPGREGGFQVELLTSTRQPELKAEAELIQQMLAESV